ncbi:MAG: sigma-54 dependent transcriptional regulator [Acidobacteriota bacterium]|nr:sigma-54 dependent transcriptional regulator [Acidobacteriota bacterium]
MARVLVVDDDPMMMRYVRNLLESEGFSVRSAVSGAAALDEMQMLPAPEVVLLDKRLPDMDGLEALQRILSLAPEAKVLMFSQQHDPAGIVQAMKLGAADYLAKPIDEELLLDAVRRYVAEEETADPGVLCEELDGSNFFLAASPAMMKLYEQVQRIAPIDMPVLITGESGTGKEVAAQLLHRHSERSARRFLKINCAAIPEDLLESELFGYDAGAFTGATTGKPGYFEQCDRGTILLDEIGEMPPRLQAKLLQVLQEQRYFRLGGKAPVTVNVRILAATNVDVKTAVEQGRFRLDLYYRLSAFHLHIPPLRERREELVPMFRQFMKRMANLHRQPVRPLSDSLQRAMMQHDWPGNVRELYNVVKRYLVLGDETLIAAPNGPTPAIQKTGSSAPPAAAASDLKKIVRRLKGEAEAEAIRDALEKTRWKRKDAAAMLGICYKALIYKSRQYGIISPREKVPPCATSATASHRIAAGDPAAVRENRRNIRVP